MNYQTDTDQFFSKSKLIKGGIIILILIITWLIQPYTYENIDAGNVGIKINLYDTDRGVDNITIVTGRVWYNRKQPALDT